MITATTTHPQIEDFVLSRDGFELRRGVLVDEMIELLLGELIVAAGTSPNRRSLLRDCGMVAQLAGAAPLKTIADEALGGDAFAVRALLFDKVSSANWRVPWHQDLAIAVEAKRDVPGFGGWSVKDGIPHVLAPSQVLEAVVTLRLHLDDCAEDNGPLRVIPGSHLAGRLGDGEIARLREVQPEFVCTTRRGDLLVMRPLLLHASSPALNTGHRRVLHLEYAARPLPDGLQWAGERVVN